MMTIRVLDKRGKIIKVCRSISECCREFGVTRREVEVSMFDLKTYRSKRVCPYAFEIVVLKEKFDEFNREMEVKKRR